MQLNSSFALKKLRNHFSSVIRWKSYFTKSSLTGAGCSLLIREDSVLFTKHFISVLASTVEYILLLFKNFENC
jgi:hypothetical protein